MNFVYIFILKNETSYFFAVPLFAASFYLLFLTLRDFFFRTFTLPQKISNLGFSLFILSILFNSLFSTEFSANMKVGQELSFKKDQVKFLKIKIFEKENYKSVIANFEIIDEKENII